MDKETRKAWLTVGGFFVGTIALMGVMIHFVRPYTATDIKTYNQLGIQIPTKYNSGSIEWDGYYKVTNNTEIMDGIKFVISRVTQPEILKYQDTEAKTNQAILETVDSNGKLRLSYPSYQELILDVEDNKYYFKKITDESTLTKTLYLSTNRWIGYSGSSVGYWNKPVIADNKTNLYFNGSGSATSGYLVYSSSTFAGSSTSGNVSLYADTESVVAAWGKEYLHMGDETIGQCHTLYQPAKEALQSLGERFVSCLINDSDLLPIRERYEAWARAKKDSYPFGY